MFDLQPTPDMDCFLSSLPQLALPGLIFLSLGACAHPTSQPSTETSAHPISQVQPSAANTPDPSTSSTMNYSTPQGQKRVTVMDEGLRIPNFTETIPANWHFQSRVGTNMQTGYYAYYMRDLRSPQGDLIRDLGPMPYVSWEGLSFDQSIQGIIQNAIQPEMQDIQFGQWQQSGFLSNLSSTRKAAQMMRQVGGQIEPIEIALTGTSQGRRIEGKLFVIHTPLPGFNGAGIIGAMVVISHSNQLNQSIQVAGQVLDSREENPQALQARQNIRNAVMQRSFNQHQARMAQNQAMFQAHQDMMRSQRETFYAQNDQWLNQNIRNSSSISGSGSGYNSHDAYIDQIHEQTSFQDPYSGQQIQKDGQFDYWYTDGLGNYHGTNDPSFNPASLQGNWQPIQPLNNRRN